jgi:uncharacterized membrane protein
MIQSRNLTPNLSETQRLRARLIASCVMFALISIPLILRLVPPNGIYGFRTGSTLSSPAIWYPANAFMGWTLLLAAVVSATLMVLLPAAVKRWVLWVALWVPVLGSMAASFAYLNRLG